MQTSRKIQHQAKLPLSISWFSGFMMPCLHSTAPGRDSTHFSYLSARRGPGGRAARWRLSRAATSSARYQRTTPRASADRFSGQTPCSSLTCRLRKKRRKLRRESRTILTFLFYIILSLLALSSSCCAMPNLGFANQSQPYEFVFSTIMAVTSERCQCAEQHPSCFWR